MLRSGQDAHGPFTTFLLEPPPPLSAVVTSAAPAFAARSMAAEEDCMARKVVTQYAVFHNIGGNSDVVFYYQGGGADSVTGIPFTEAAFIVDLLRHEKPMSYDATLKRLSTYSLEPVGEGE